MSLMLHEMLLNGSVPTQITELARSAPYTSIGASSNYIASGLNIGTASPTRRVIALIASRFTAAIRSLTSATINGIGATIHCQTTAGTNPCVLVAIASVIVPTATTANINVTFSGPMDNIYIALLSLDGVAAGPPADTATSTANNSFINNTIDYIGGSYVVSQGAVLSASPDPSTWANTTEWDDRFVSPMHASNAVRNPATTTLNASLSMSGSVSNFRALCSVTFAKA